MGHTFGTTFAVLAPQLRRGDARNLRQRSVPLGLEFDRPQVFGGAAVQARSVVTAVKSIVQALMQYQNSETASMKADRSALASVPAKVMVCAPVVATENGMLNKAKLVLDGETRLPIWTPSTLTLIGCA